MRQEFPNWQIVDAADQYEDAAALLYAQPPGSGVLWPLINTAAISIELYLKSLSAERIYTADDALPEISVVSARALTRSHSLVSLFESVPEVVRNKMLSAFDAQLRSDLNVDFVSALAKLDGAFVMSRYPFEFGPTAAIYSLKHLLKIAKFLRTFVRSLAQ